MKKEKYIEYNGLFHNGVDYNVYHMTVKDIVIGMIVGGVATAVVVQIFFGLLPMTIICTPIGAVGGLFVYKEMLLKKRKDRLVLQFRDMLESISSSLGSGRNVNDSFLSAVGDLKDQYGENAEIVRELEIIKNGISNNVNIEILLQDFAKRSHDENIHNFADVFEVANRRGGNIRQIIYETKNTIIDKITIERDIQTVISGKKNELNIMMFLPLIVVNQTKSLQEGSAGNEMFNFFIKLLAFAIFVGAYFIGRKMMKIEV